MIKITPKMKCIFIFVFLFTSGVFFFSLPEKVSAQSKLERISANERSDGKGYVVRYHLTEIADSFKIVQPSPDQIQMMIYSQDLDTLGLRLPDNSENITNIAVHTFNSGIGIDLFLSEGNYFRADAYPDRNKTDLLLSLERTTIDEIDALTEGTEAIAWRLLQAGDEGVLNTSEDSEEDNSFLRLHDSMDFNVIVLDAGHGGHDPGARGVGGIWEKNVVLDITLKVGEYIKEYLPDVEVVYTRNDDTFVPLSERGLTATRSKGDLFVSIHANAVDNSPSANGTETFFLGLARSESALEVMKRENSVVDLENGPGSLDLSEEELLIYELTNSGNMAISERIATMIEGQFKDRAGRRSRGVKQAGLEALWHASTPAVLVELGFLSNPQEVHYLTSDYGQNIMASAIFRAIRDFKEEYERSALQNGRSRASSNR